MWGYGDVLLEEVLDMNHGLQVQEAPNFSGSSAGGGSVRFNLERPDGTILYFGIHLETESSIRKAKIVFQLDSTEGRLVQQQVGSGLTEPEEALREMVDLAAGHI
jgi:hypothetical protein